MRQKLHDMLVQTATPQFNPGETVSATGRARVGQVSVARNLALAAASTVLSGGTMGMYAVNKAYYVLLTNERLLLLEPHWITSRPTPKVLGDIPRQLVSVSDVKRGAMTSVTLSIGGEGRGLLLRYPALDKEGAESLLKALGAPAT